MEEINLRDLLSYFKKHLVLFVVMVLFVVSAGTVYSVFIQKPEYKAQATVILSSDKSKTTIQNEINANKNLIDTYTEVVKSHRVLDRVKSEMQINDSYEQLVKKVTVASLKDTEIISISVVDLDKYHSYSLANKIADTFTDEISQIYNDKSVNVLDRAVEPQKPYNVDIIKQEAIYTAAGIILATAVIFLMFYFDRTIKTTEQIEQLFKLPIFGKVRKLETEKQKQQRRKRAEKAAKLEAKQAAKLEKEQQKEAKKAEKLAAKLEKQEKNNLIDVDFEEANDENTDNTQAEQKAEVKPVVEIKAVGRKIIAEEKAKQEKLAAEEEMIENENETDDFNEEILDEDSELVLRDNPKSKVSEDFRTIRTSLYFSLSSKGSNAVLISSSTPNEGKSFIASNLAVAFAKTKKKVLLIDCDMRLGRQHEIFGLSNKEGLSNLLAENKAEEYRKYLQKTTVKNLSVITRGVVPPNPSELLDSLTMETLLEKVKQKFDYVILDGTPIDGLSDSLILAKKTDRLVLVSAANMTTIEDLQNSKKALESIEVKISGVVLNRTIDERRGDKYNKYYN